MRRFWRDERPIRLERRDMGKESGDQRQTAVNGRDGKDSWEAPGSVSASREDKPARYFETLERYTSAGKMVPWQAYCDEMGGGQHF